MLSQSKMGPISIGKTLALGAGCYWGTEKYVVRDFQQRRPGSIAKARVGFMSPHADATKNPTYAQVCSGTTGHVEVLDVELADPTPEAFEDLIRFFFRFHDPTTLNRQGNDAGTQYASVIFCATEEQCNIARRVKEELQALLDRKKIDAYEGTTIHTLVADYTEFYEAHEEHQEYLMKNPSGYCNHRIRFREWPEL